MRCLGPTRRIARPNFTPKNVQRRGPFIKSFHRLVCGSEVLLDNTRLALSFVLLHRRSAPSPKIFITCHFLEFGSSGGTRKSAESFGLYVGKSAVLTPRRCSMRRSLSVCTTLEVPRIQRFQCSSPSRTGHRFDIFLELFHIQLWLL